DRAGTLLPAPAKPWAVGGHPDLGSADLGLTARQLDVLALMMRGKSNKAISRALDLAETTVKNHVTAILKAFKASNRTEAVAAGQEMGWHCWYEAASVPHQEPQALVPTVHEWRDTIADG